jgi:hypothetical protein
MGPIAEHKLTSAKSETRREVLIVLISMWGVEKSENPDCDAFRARQARGETLTSKTWRETERPPSEIFLIADIPKLYGAMAMFQGRISCFEP